ncbi:MAG TPA: hypothetical protein VF162_01430 [Streptosporangiaceae bacterium]
MTTQQQTTEADSGAAPVACSLTPTDLAEQGGRWERLAALALTERAETEHGLRLSFRPEPGVDEELRQLVAVENDCCRWAKWTVDTRAGQIVLDARSTGDGISALHNMFTGLHPARR